MDPFLVWLTVAIGGLGAFTGWLARDYIGYLKSNGARALDIADAQVKATEKLTDAVHELVRDRGSR